MQSALLPTRIIWRLDQLCRQFYWGHVNERRKLHTLAWEVLCRPRNCGGLGFPNLRLWNELLLCKLIWRLLRSPMELSSSILIGKYGGWPALLTEKPPSSSSSLWRGLRSLTSLFQTGLRWHQDTPFWGLTGNGLFSSASLRRFVQDAPRIPQHIPWRRVWTFSGPTRQSFTIWASLHQALPTASLLWRRRILPSPLCDWCTGAVQTPLHLLRDCSFSRLVWILIIEPEARPSFFGAIDIVAWMSPNLRTCSRFSSFRQLWPYVFKTNRT